MENEDNVWQKFDKVISHLVRDKQVNLAVEAGKARDEHLKLMEEFRDYKNGKRKITPCHDSMFKQCPCLEDEERYGFFKSEADIRPSSCTWIKKEDAEKLYGLFTESRGE